MSPLYRILSLSILLSIQQKHIDCTPFPVNKMPVPEERSFDMGVKNRQSTLSANHYASVQISSLQSFSANFSYSETKQSSNPQNGGYTLDPCRAESDCQGTRLCVDMTNNFRQICNGASLCACIPYFAKGCSTSDDCEEKEGCILTITGLTGCASREAVADIGYLLIPGRRDLPGVPSPAITPAPSNCRGGRTFDKCSSNLNCLGRRTCRRRIFRGLCHGSPSCICAPVFLQKCTSPESCLCGEVCMTNFDTNKFCGSKDVALKRGIPYANRVEEESPLPAADSVCINVKFLNHVSPTDLVYERHQLAHVLCDKEDSCATASHMVTFEGKAMMMSGYCVLVVCEKKIMRVNSPKWGRKLRIDSNTEGLMFTAFAARYNTGTEEKILSTLVRIGL